MNYDTFLGKYTWQDLLKLKMPTYNSTIGFIASKLFCTSKGRSKKRYKGLKNNFKAPICK